MRQFYLTLGVWMVLSGWINVAEAQTPVPVPVWDYSPPNMETTGAPISRPLPVAPPYDQYYSVDLVIGFPTGVRVQRELGGEAGRGWLLEGVAGVGLVFPMAGGGVRRRVMVARGGRGSFSVSPGVNAYMLYNTLHDGWFSGGPSTLGLVTADVDILWQRAVSDRCSGHLGIKLGAGAAFGVREVTVPVVGVVFGFNF